MGKRRWILMICLLVTGLVGSAQVKIVSYQAFNDSINHLENLELYEEARKYLENCRGSIAFLDPFSFLKEEIYLNEKLGKHQDNMVLFKDGQHKGFFFMLHDQIPKYKPYLKFPGFKDLVIADQTLRNETNKTAKAEYLVVLPEAYNNLNPYPALFIFHGGGSNMIRAQKHWVSKKLDTQYIRVFIQSALHYDFNTYGWRNSDTSGLEDFQTIAEKVINEHSIDPDRIYLGGISAGGTQAIFTAFKQPIKIQGYIGICTGIPNQLTSEDFQNKTIAAYMIAGEMDRYKPRQDSLAKIFTDSQIKHHYRIVEGMGHEYPRNFDQWIDNGLQYLEQYEKK